MKKILLLGTLTLLVSQHFAQQKLITDVATAMKKYKQYGIGISRKDVEKAKNSINEAAVHPETKNDYKMFFYRGLVYFALSELILIENFQNSSEKLKEIEEYEIIFKESFIKLNEDPKKKWVRHRDEFLHEKLYNKEFCYFKLGLEFWENKDLFNSSITFGRAYQINQLMAVEDTVIQQNCVSAFGNFVKNKLEINDYDSSINLANIIYEIMPKNIEVLRTIIEIYLQNGDISSSEKYLNEALAIDPRNAQMYYVLGTAYLNRNENEKAEQALLKALEFDANYFEARYQLGANYINWADNLEKKRDEFDYKDSEYQNLDNRIEELFEKTLSQLILYVESNPKDCNIFQTISKIYYNKKNEEKELEYKQKFLDCRKKN